MNIDDLISEKGAVGRDGTLKYRPGMDKPDHDIINKVGRGRWEAFMKAEQRLEER